MKHFPNIKIDDVARLSGEDDILIGYDYAGWHPTPEIVSGHLVLLNNIFGKWVGGRFSPSREIKGNTGKSVLNMAYVNNVTLDGILHQFVAIESSGVQCEPKCGSCKCGTCPIGGKPFSLREERELKMIEDKLEFRGSYWIT